MNLATTDLVIIGLYAVFIVFLAYWVSREKDGHEKNTTDYFLAGKSLPWWAIGASLIAANISAEQIIGMSGSGFALGMGIASYEWMAAITLIIVGKYFLPIFLKEGIYSMPQYLEKRYDHRVRMVMAIFWIALYVFVNLAAILWLGALAMNTIAGIELTHGLIILAVLATAYSLYGGLKAVALTDIIQVVLLVLGGLLVTYLALDKVADGAGAIVGFQMLTDQLPEKFDMIFAEDSPHYKLLPGLTVLIGGMWVMNLSYWGCNQYIIQRALAAKSVAEAQKGIMFAAGLKVLMPVFVVLPGIAAAMLVPNLAAPDQAYPEMMKLVPIGLKGLVFAALIAAILSSLGSMMNSISTIFTMDLYRHFKSEADEKKLLKVGRISALSSIIVATIIAQPLLGQSEQAFQFIQEFTGFFTPGIVVLFLCGLFWKRATANGALAAAITSFVLSGLFWAIAKYELVDIPYLVNLPFLDRVGYVFLAALAVLAIISLNSKQEESPAAANIGNVDFSTSSAFNIGALMVTLVLAALYITWW